MGTWFLVCLYFNMDNQLISYPVYVYSDAVFAEQLCLRDKQELSIKYSAPFECVQESEI